MSSYVAHDGCRIHYETFGSRGPRLLLIPGLGGDGRFWSGVVRLLEADHRLVVSDHRGAGRSDRPDGPYSIPQIAADMAGLIEALGGPLHVVGHSTGGAIAQVLALDHSDHALSCTISSSWARADARFQELFVARAELLEAGLAEVYQRLTHVLCHEANYLDANRIKLEDAVASAATALAPLPVTARRVRMLLDHDRLADLSRITMPVRVLAAEGDVLTPLDLSQAMVDAIPGSVLHVLRGAHFHPLARPEGIASVLRRFVAEVDREH